jgi:hypothetical protein
MAKIQRSVDSSNGSSAWNDADVALVFSSNTDANDGVARVIHGRLATIRNSFIHRACETIRRTRVEYQPRGSIQQLYIFFEKKK